MIIDCHFHSTLSDGALLPTELIRRCEKNGYYAMAITDHADAGTIKDILEKLKPSLEMANKYSNIKVFPGVEITHVHPKGIKRCVEIARENGAKIVIVHGESPIEPVYKGTNKAAIEAGCDILAHPGRIELKHAELAAEKNVFLEISNRRGSSLSNGYIYNIAKKTGAKLIVNSDGHSPSDIFSEHTYLETALGTGMSKDEFDNYYNVIKNWIDNLK